MIPNIATWVRTRNQGVEATLNWYAVNRKNFTLSFSGNIGFNKTEIQAWES